MTFLFLNMTYKIRKFMLIVNKYYFIYTQMSNEFLKQFFKLTQILQCRKVLHCT